MVNLALMASYILAIGIAVPRFFTHPGLTPATLHGTPVPPPSPSPDQTL